MPVGGILSASGGGGGGGRILSASGRDSEYQWGGF